MRVAVNWVQGDILARKLERDWLEKNTAPRGSVGVRRKGGVT